MSEFVMPKVFVGDTVLFSRIPEDEPTQMAKVCRVCGDNISVLWVASNTGYQGRVGVRHRDDPKIKEFPDCIQDGGVWIESQQMKDRARLYALEGQVEQLASALGAVEMSVAKPGRGRKEEVALST